MAKKINKTSITQKKEGDTVADKPFIPYPGIPVWVYRFRVQAFIVAALALIFYANTFNNDYALDDTALIEMNQFVHRGFAGIPDILSKDAYFSYYDQLHSTNQLTGGRYRPLSIVTFAIEQQFFGTVPEGGVDSVTAYGVYYDTQHPYEKEFIHQMHVRHVVNVAWYMLTVVVLLYFLRFVVFKSNPLMAFVGALIFTIHPLHTEVVANVKSRDEIMSVFFIALTFILAFKYRKAPPGLPRRVGFLVAALACYFLAFLSKEYAITLVLLLPLAFYLFNKDPVSKSVIASLPFFGVALIYIIIRLNVIGPRNELSDSDIQINPYALASASEKPATEIATSLTYLKLLIFPHPLSSDYSYNQIPYKDFGSPLVWFSLVVHLGLLAGLVYFFRKRSVLCFAIAFYLFNLLMINNFIFDVGATMGERLVFHSSIGFAIALAWLLVKGMEKIKKPRAGAVALACVLLVMTALSGFKTIERNKDWKNDVSLFMQDINVSPNSFLINENVGVTLVNTSDMERDEQTRVANLQRAVRLFSRVITMQKDYVLGYMNRATAYDKLGITDSMVADLDKVRSLYPIHPQLPDMYYNAGMLYLSRKQYEKAAAAFQVSLNLRPGDPEVQNQLNKAEAAQKTPLPALTDSNLNKH